MRTPWSQEALVAEVLLILGGLLEESTAAHKVGVAWNPDALRRHTCNLALCSLRFAVKPCYVLSYPAMRHPIIACSIVSRGIRLYKMASDRQFFDILRICVLHK
jgi:hypothetical protein